MPAGNQSRIGVKEAARPTRLMAGMIKIRSSVGGFLFISKNAKEMLFLIADLSHDYAKDLSVPLFRKRPKARIRSNPANNFCARIL